MPQIKEDKFIAEAYQNIAEIALKPTESIDDIKKRYLYHMVIVTRRGKKRFTSPTGQVFSLDRIFLMINDANTLKDLKQVINTIGFPFVYYSDIYN